MPEKLIEIRWRDLDGFGHVNNSTYLTYLEEARDEFFTTLLGETVHRIVVRRIEIEYHSGLVFEDDYVGVSVDVTAVGGSSVSTHERIVSRRDGRLAAEARSVLVHTNHDRNASADWPDADRAALEGVAV